MQHFLTFELTFRKLYRMASKAYLHSFRIFALQCAFKGVVDNIEDLHMNRFHFIAANLTCFGLILYLVVGSHKSEPDVRARWASFLWGDEKQMQIHVVRNLWVLVPADTGI